MDWQLPVVLLIVAAAAAYVARITWRAWVGSKTGGCGGGCGCANKPAEAKAQTIQLGIRRDRTTADRK
ncbi:MAG: FeoB-associated Cys-rich membrane protein [Gemmataceae bacterium]